MPNIFIQVIAVKKINKTKNNNNTSTIALGRVGFEPGVLGFQA